MAASQQMSYMSSSPLSPLSISSTPTSMKAPTISRAHTLRSVRALPSLPKLSPMDLTFDAQSGSGQDPIVAKYAAQAVQQTGEIVSNNGAPARTGSKLGRSNAVARRGKRRASSAARDSGVELSRTVVVDGEKFNFPAPPKSEVQQYVRKPLPSQPSAPKTVRKDEQNVGRMVQSVSVHKAGIYLQAECLRGSQAASIHVMADDGEMDELPNAVNQTQPVPTMKWLDRTRRREQWEATGRLERRATTNS